jgi:outer membrane protein assembly factor BamB
MMRCLFSRIPDRSTLRTLVVLLAGLTASEIARADWPLYRGPAGNGVSTERIRTDWDTTPPRLLWRKPLTNGLSSVTLSGGRVFTQVKRGSTDYALALSATNGTILWTAPVGTANYPDGGVGSDDGPRSTPVVRGDRVFVLGSYLNLHCLDAAGGQKVWSKDLRTEFGGSVIPWQNAASPLLEGEFLYLNLNAGTTRLAALRLTDGSVAWRRHNEAMTHSTPIATTIEGVRQIIFLTQSGLVAVNPADGAQLWRHTPIPYSTSIAVTPVVDSNRVYYAGAYSMGSAAARIVRSGTTWSAQQLVARRSSRMIHWSTPVAVNGYIYGLFGSASGQLRCLDLQKNGDYAWQDGPEFGTGATILAAGKILVAAENGEVVLVEPDPTQYRELTRFQAVNGRIWNSPAISDGVLYVRGTSELAAYDLAAPPPPPLHLSAEFDRAAGRLRFTVANVDGTAIDPGRVDGIELRESLDPSRPRATWSPAGVTLSLGGSVLTGDLPLTPGTAAQFFSVNEGP